MCGGDAMNFLSVILLAERYPDTLARLDALAGQ